MSPKAYAYSSSDTYFDVSIPEFPSILSDYVDSSSTMTYYDFFEHLIDIYNNSSNGRNFVILFGISGSSPNTIYDIKIKIFLDDAITYGVVSYGANNSGYFSFHITTTQDYHYRQYEISSSNKPFNIKLDTTYLNIVNCISGLSCSSSENMKLSFVGIGNNGRILNDSDRSVDFSSIPNNVVSSYFYYSSKPITLDSYESNSFYSKKLKINGVEYGYNSLIPSYKDLYIPITTTRENNIGTIYIGNISKNNISDFIYNGNFYFDDYSYASSLNPIFSFFGRINHGNYYSYDRLSCSSDIYSSFAINNDLKKVNFTLLPNGFTCSNDLSSYDNIYIRVDFKYNSDSNSSIIGYIGSSNYGYSTKLSDTLVSYTGVDIFETFENLPSNFSYVLSTLDPEDKAYFITGNEYVQALNVDLFNDNFVEGASYNPISFGQTIQKNALIYNLEDYYSGLTYLKLFLDDSTICSPYNNGYTYYNSGGVLETDDIIHNRGRIPTGNYDTTYYRNIVSNYIDNLSNDINSFSLFIQRAYDTSPSFLQTFIYVVFILICFYFTYKLIRK